MMMKRILLSLLLACGSLDTAQPADAPKASLLLTGGRVRTPSGWTEAVAIRDGVIIGVGASKDLEPLRGQDTRVIELKGKTVLPGMQDMHIHGQWGGLIEGSCFIPTGSTPAQLLEKIRACVVQTSAGGWVQAGYFDPVSFDREKMLASLDAVSPNNPVIIRSVDQHTTWANSLALKAAGYTRATPNPPGGIIERDAKGELNGVLADTAAFVMLFVAPQPTFEQRVVAAELTSRRLASFGITSYTEAVGLGDDQAVLAAVADKGTLLQRTRMCNLWAPARTGFPEMGAEVIPLRNLYARPLLDTSCVKLFVDGIPTLTHTSQMLEPYAPLAGKPADDRGFLQMDEATLSSALTRFDAQGLQIKVHACGDGAVRATLNAFEVVRQRNGFTRPHEIAHWCFAKPEDIARARALGLTIELSAYLWDPADPIHRDIATAVGSERMAHFFPAATAIKSGANVTLGSDWPAVTSPNPWPGLESLVTRRQPGDAKGPMVAGEERITIDQALKLITENGARQLGQESKTGRLEAGMLADLIVIDRNPYEVAPTEIGKTRVLMTFVNGKVVYSADDNRN